LIERGSVLATQHLRRTDMLRWALIFFVIGIIAAVLGFTSVAGATFAVAKFLAGLFLVLFVVFLLLGVMAGKRVIS
jgi:uncharacterized membrane protein YtjA (UPF0391 family)